MAHRRAWGGKRDPGPAWRVTTRPPRITHTGHASPTRPVPPAAAPSAIKMQNISTPPVSHVPSALTQKGSRFEENKAARVLARYHYRYHYHLARYASSVTSRERILQRSNQTSVSLCSGKPGVGSSIRIGKNQDQILQQRERRGTQVSGGGQAKGAGTVRAAGVLGVGARGEMRGTIGLPRGET